MKIYEISDIIRFGKEYVVINTAKSGNGYIEFSDGKCILFNGKAFNNVVIKSLKTGAVINHSVAIVAIIHHLSTAIQFEVY